MKNWIDPQMAAGHKQQAEAIISELKLTGLRVVYEEKNKLFRFIQDRRVVSVPLALIEGQSWSDIRHLFRAILSQSPAIWNHGAPNEWGPIGDPYKRDHIPE